MARKSGVTREPDGTIVRVTDSLIGDQFVSTLRWCLTHQEPVWVYDDDSYECPYDVMVEANSVHSIIDGPWQWKANEPTRWAADGAPEHLSATNPPDPRTETPSRKQSATE